MTATLREVARTAWAFRWAAVTVFLYSTGQRESWPYSLVQLAACVFLPAMIAAACAHIRLELTRRLWPVPVPLRPGFVPAEVPSWLTPGTITAAQVRPGVVLTRSAARGGER
jgi:hypothetical protein